MASAQPIDWAALAPAIASRLLGEPNKRLSSARELRYGTHGSLSIDLEKGSFYDHEAKAGGGMLALIQRERGGDEAAALSWMESEGLKDRREASVWTIGQRQPSSIFYDYRDEAGNVAYRIERRTGADGRKTFRQRAADGKGGWRTGSGCMEGVKRLPYRLPELLAADPNRVVFIVEGEKDADRLASAGLVATTNSEGDMRFTDDLVPYFAGRQVVVIPDNDRAGRAHAALVLSKLAPVAAKLTLLELPGLPDKGDVSDWLDAGNSIDDLKVRAASAINDPVLVAGLGDNEQVGDPAPSIAATPYAWREPNTLPLREWLYGYWLLAGTVTAVIAPGGVGKSTLLAGTALSLASGRPLLGKSIWGEAKGVWLWNLEDDLDEMSRSIQAAAKRYGICESDLGGRLYVNSGMDGSELCTAVEDASGFRLLAPVFEAITAELIRRRIRVLIIDPFVSSHAVEENSNAFIDKIAKAWGRVAKAANCAIVLVHHTSKAGSAEVTALSGRGAVALVNACRQALVLNRMEKDAAERLGIPEDEVRRYFSVQDDKANRAPPEKADWYHLASVSLDNGPQGDLGFGDSIGVAEPWSVPDPFANITPQHLLQVQCRIAEGEWRKDWQAKAWAGHPVADVLGLNATDKADRARIRKLIDTWVKEGALVEVERRDEKRMMRTWIEVGHWQNDESAPPQKGEARQGGAVGREGCHTTTPPIRGGCGEARQGKGDAVGQGRGEAWNANPALGRRGRGPILAPGESLDDPVPGWE